MVRLQRPVQRRCPNPELPRNLTDALAFALKGQRLRHIDANAGTTDALPLTPGALSEQIDTRSAAGRLVLNVLASVSQWEREAIDAQRAKATAYAQLYDLELAEVIVDAGESAKSLDRPGLQRALGMLKTGDAEALLVVKLDRLTPQRPGPRASCREVLRPREVGAAERGRADRHAQRRWLSLRRVAAELERRGVRSRREGGLRRCS